MCMQVMEQQTATLRLHRAHSATARRLQPTALLQPARLLQIDWEACVRYDRLGASVHCCPYRRSQLQLYYEVDKPKHLGRCKVACTSGPC